MSSTTLEMRRAENFRNRHGVFLRAALARMRTHGLHAVNLTDLAAASEYSKGTWYNHFRSAEALYVEGAIINAELIHSYITDIRQRDAASDADRLVAVFIGMVAHAIIHPEIWTLGINARIWDKNPEAGVVESVSRLGVVEQQNYAQILEIALAAQTDPHRSQEDATEALDMVRAAADGLCILAIAQAEHRWTPEATNAQTGTLLTAALRAAGFPDPSQADLDVLCGQAWQRVGELSQEWLIPRSTPEETHS